MNRLLKENKRIHFSTSEVDLKRGFFPFCNWKIMYIYLYGSSSLHQVTPVRTISFDGRGRLLTFPVQLDFERRNVYTIEKGEKLETDSFICQKQASVFLCYLSKHGKTLPVSGMTGRSWLLNRCSRRRSGTVNSIGLRIWGSRKESAANLLGNHSGGTERTMWFGHPFHLLLY